MKEKSNNNSKTLEKKRSEKVKLILGTTSPPSSLYKTEKKKIIMENMSNSFIGYTESSDDLLKETVIDILTYFKNGLSDVEAGSGERQPMQDEIEFALPLLKKVKFTKDI